MKKKPKLSAEEILANLRRKHAERMRRYRAKLRASKPKRVKT